MGFNSGFKGLKRYYNEVCAFVGHTVTTYQITVRHPEKGIIYAGHPITCLCKHRGAAHVSLQSIRNSELEGGGWQIPCCSRFTSRKGQAPIAQECGWARRYEYFYVTGIRYRYLTARSKSLYRLRYPECYNL